jgi:hypothetical protein
MPASDGNNYLKSGVYFLDNVGTWTIAGWMVGGLPASGESRQTAGAGCGTESGVSGVTIILGGNSNIVLASGAHLELFSLAGAAGTTGVGIRQLLSTDPAPWAALASNVVGTILTDGVGAQTQMAIHGNVYVPKANVVLGAPNSGTAKLRGGLVTGGVSLSSTGTNVMDVSTSTGTGERQIVITSTVNQQAPEKVVTAIAVVRVANDSARTVNIDSWVVSNP